MKVNITIEKDDDDEDASVNMGISAEGLDPFDVAKLLLAGAEMSMYNMVRGSLEGNGASAEMAEYGAPLRTRLLATEILLNQELTPYSWVALEL
jgi:hypothetical protein